MSKSLWFLALVGPCPAYPAVSTIPGQGEGEASTSTRVCVTGCVSQTPYREVWVEGHLVSEQPRCFSSQDSLLTPVEHLRSLEIILPLENVVRISGPILLFSELPLMTDTSQPILSLPLYLDLHSLSPTHWRCTPQVQLCHLPSQETPHSTHPDKALVWRHAPPKKYVYHTSFQALPGYF